MEKGSIQSDQGSTKSTVLSLALGSTGCVGGADPFIWWHRSIQTFIQLPPHRDTSVFKIPARPLTAATESTGTWEPSRCQTLQVLVYGNGIEILSSSNSLVPNKTFPDGSEELRQLAQTETPQSTRNGSDQMKLCSCEHFIHCCFLLSQNFCLKKKLRCQWTSQVMINSDTIELAPLKQLGLISWTVVIEWLYIACTKKCISLRDRDLSLCSLFCIWEKTKMQKDETLQLTWRGPITH